MLLGADWSIPPCTVYKLTAPAWSCYAMFGQKSLVGSAFTSTVLKLRENVLKKVKLYDFKTAISDIDNFASKPPKLLLIKHSTLQTKI